MSKALWQDIQRWAGVADDGVPGPATARAIAVKAGLVEKPAPFDRAAFLARHVNLNADAIRPVDIRAAADKLGVTEKHIEAIRKIESRGQSFGPEGRPIILFEPHVFHKRTKGKHSPSSFSYARWKEKPYPATQAARWGQMADAAERDEAAAIESASWGLFQIMGFNWSVMNYPSARAFADAMVRSEGDQLDAVVRFIMGNGLAPALRRCVAGKPDSCRDFARGYNGARYAENGYHTKLAEALK